MPLHPVLLDKLNAALAPAQQSPATQRDASLPPIPGKVHSVIGMRRAGKTTFLFQLLEARRKKAAAECAIYLNFDDDRLAGIGVDQLDSLLEEYYRIVPGLRGQRTSYFFLDEIQLVSGWDRFSRRVLDTERIELVVSGSSARLLSREVHTSLRGRGMATVIRPFSFGEFLRHRSEEPDKPSHRWSTAARSRIEGRLREYLTQGGFPEAQGLGPTTRIELLQGYVDTVIFRDVVERHHLSQVSALRWVVRQCLRNPAGLFSVHRINQDLKAQGLGVARDIVHGMLAQLSDAFLLSTVWLATDSERQRNSNPRKIYPADPGLIRAFDASGRSNLGHALETVVLNELERRKAEIGYVKCESGRKVDFLARFPAGEEELIQVCADVADKKTLARELEGLIEAGYRYPRAKNRLLVPDHESALRVKETNVSVQAVSGWLLDHDR